MQKVQCPYCKNPVEFTIEHAMTQDRLCCMSCNKAFDIAELKQYIDENNIVRDIEDESFNYTDDDEF